MRQPNTRMQLDALQLAWLHELGVDAALLRRYAIQALARTEARRHSATVQLPSRTTSERAASNILKPPLPGRPVRAPQKTAAAPLAQSSAPLLHRQPHLACQVYVPQHSVNDGQQTPSSDWLVVSETPATTGAVHTLVPQRAAQLLHAMLAAVNMQPTDAIFRFQTQILPQTRTHETGLPNLQTQIKDRVTTLQPACILALGRAAAAALLQTPEDLQSLRGKVWRYAASSDVTIPVIVTYPPGWLLANAQHKADVWRDLLLARTCATRPDA